MTVPRSYPNYRGDVVYAAEKAREFTAGMDFTDFTADDKTVFAVIRTIEIMGEATGRTPSEVLRCYPQIPWRRIVDMRNRVIHNYDTLTYTSSGQLLSATFLSCLPRLEQTGSNEIRLPIPHLVPLPAPSYNLLAMQIKDLGEFGLIGLLNEMVVKERGGLDNGASFGFELMVDTGDDTAAWRSGPAAELFTTDTVVEGIHFTRETTPWRDLGWKSLAANISDIAAMGGLPLYALITLGLPPETEVADIQEMYQGMLEIGNEFGVGIIGGDMVRSPVAFVTVALTGVHAGEPMLRSTAKPGDQVAVTGYLGTSAGGLKLMLEALSAPQEAGDFLRRGHRRPFPAVAEGLSLAQAGVKTAMDVSDGLVDDLSKLCRASGVSARLFTAQVPVHRLLRLAFPEDCLALALGGGEDYLLLFATDSSLMPRAIAGLPEGAAVIGEIMAGTPGQVLLVDDQGDETVAGSAGWDHFG